MKPEKPGNIRITCKETKDKRKQLKYERNNTLKNMKNLLKIK